MSRFAPTACRICGETLDFARRGSGFEHQSSAFRPTSHPPGEHGDLYRCGTCGTIQQPSLPQGADLRDLYRDVSDPDYLGEERGRRHTARWLLDLLGRYVPRGRLLEVGCGYGLLLDEARRRGYETEGLELSREAVAHARETLGLSVEDVAFEDAALEGRRYDAVLLVDVLEHFDDPARALTRASDLLAPRGALLVVTPDPSSLTARLAGGRWWAYLPSHFCLIPRDTLHALIHARRLALVEDVLSRHSFTPGYWLAGLAERSSWAAGAIARLAGKLPRTVLLTASLGDERVMLARRVEAGGPEQPSA